MVSANDFLEQQKSLIAKNSESKKKQQLKSLPNQEISWKSVLLTALVLLGVYFWWMAANEVPVSQITTETKQPISPILKALPIRELENFIVEGTSSDLPKHFKFERLRFISGEVGIARESGPELDRVAAVMKQYPHVKIRLEGFTDNVGPEERNRTISLRRARLVKDQIVARGVDVNRIEIFGYGSDKPIANNALVHGRAINNRIELVVTGLK